MSDRFLSTLDRILPNSERIAPISERAPILEQRAQEVSITLLRRRNWLHIGAEVGLVCSFTKGIGHGRSTAKRGCELNKSWLGKRRPPNSRTLYLSVPSHQSPTMAFTSPVYEAKDCLFATQSVQHCIRRVNPRQSPHKDPNVLADLVSCL